MRGADIGVAGVTGDRREDADADASEEWADLPDLAGNVVFAQEIDVEGGRNLRFAGPMTWSRSASPASLLPKFFDPAKPGAVTGMTGVANRFAASAQTASTCSPDRAGTQVT